MSVSTDEQQTIIVQPKRHWSQLGLLILAWALGVMRAALAPLAPADRAEAAWARARAAGSAAAWREFLDKYPRSPRAPEARAAIEAMDSQRASRITPAMTMASVSTEWPWRMRRSGSRLRRFSMSLMSSKDFARLRLMEAAAASGSLAMRLRRSRMVGLT